MIKHEHEPALKYLSRQVEWRALRNGIIATVLLGVLIVAGSRNLRHFDAALVGYTFATLFATFGLVYRYSVWLTKPPTRKYWRRGWQLFFSPALWKNLRSPRVLTGAIWHRLIWQGFVLRRGWDRWLGHMLIAWGCVLAAAITFPLVWGWVHFELAQTHPEPTYRAMLFGFPAGDIPLRGVVSWLTFHGLVVASFMVIPGVMIAMYRRLRDGGAVAVQRFGRDMLPLILLFAVSFTGLLLWISYEWLEGYFYSVLAQVHAFTVIGTLIYLPFGKLFHIFQRPATIGIAYYRAANAEKEPALCPLTGKPFAAKMQTEDLKEVLHELEFDYTSTKPGAPEWNEVSPQGRRMLIGRAQARAKRGAF